MTEITTHNLKVPRRTSIIFLDISLRLPVYVSRVLVHLWHFALLEQHYRLTKLAIHQIG